MKKKEFRKAKIRHMEVFDEMQERNYQQRKKEWDLFKRRAYLDMDLTRLRIIKEQVDNAIDKVKAKEKDIDSVIEMFLGYLDQIEAKTLSIEQVREIIKK